MRTKRGFQIYGRLKDTYRQVIRVQESSAIGPRRVWLFCDLDGNGKQPEHHLGQCNCCFPLLSKAQAKRLAIALLRFVEES